MKHVTRRSLIRNTKAATALEFALVSGMLMALLFGGLEAGIMLWTRGTLQTVAAQTARCMAIGSPLCATAQAFAVSKATSWLGSAMITAADVTAATSTSCLSQTSGTTTFEVVTITVTPWAGSSIYPFGNRTETVTACFPK